jgi:hypothetical protein
LENGALKTATPRLAAAARSIWLTPMQKAPTATRSGAAAHVANGLDELVLAQGARQRVDLISRFDQPSRRVRVDILEQQSPRRHQNIYLSHD